MPDSTLPEDKQAAGTPVPRLSKFPSETLTSYLERARHHFLRYGVEAKHHAYDYLMGLSNDEYGRVTQAMLPKKVTSILWAELAEVVKNLELSDTNKSRLALAQLTRQPGQSIQDYALRINALTVACAYDKFSGDEVARQVKFMSSFTEPHILEALYSKSADTKFDDLVKTAISAQAIHDSARAKQQEVVAPVSVSTSTQLFALEGPQSQRQPTSSSQNQSTRSANTEVTKLQNKIRGILNKLTPQKFEKLLAQILDIPIDREDHLKEMVNLVFEKAIVEPSFTKPYADLCQRLQKKVIQARMDTNTASEGQAAVGVTFRKLLLSKCQEEFENNNKADRLDIGQKQKEIDETTDVEKKKELKLLLEEDERKIRRKSVGLVRFVGELYKLHMLTPKIMHGCITTLLSQVAEEPLECLCELLTTIGKKLEKESGKKEFDEYFAQMGKLAQKTPESKVPSRIRFMLQDVIELRQKGWKPRAPHSNPWLHPGDRRNTRSNQDNDGWQTPGNKYNRNTSYTNTIEASKLQHLKNSSDGNEPSADVKKHRDSLVQILQTDSDKTFDEACSFLSKIEDSVPKRAFIEIVTQAVIKASLKDGKLILRTLAKLIKLIQKYVDNTEELELTCLFAVKNFVVNECALELSVLTESFRILYDDSIISVEAFNKWKDDTSIEPKESKGRLIATRSLEPFYVFLAEEADYDDDDS